MPKSVTRDAITGWLAHAHHHGGGPSMTDMMRAMSLGGHKSSKVPQQQIMIYAPPAVPSSHHQKHHKHAKHRSHTKHHNPGGGGGRGKKVVFETKTRNRVKVYDDRTPVVATWEEAWQTTKRLTRRGKGNFGI